MQLKVIQRFERNGEELVYGNVIDVSESVAHNLLRAHLVVPADGTDAPDSVYLADLLERQPSHSAGTPEGVKESPAASGPCNACDAPERKGGQALSVCTKAGCSCLVVSGPCRGCARQAGRGRRTSVRTGGWHTRRWRDASRAYRREHPYCEDESHMDTPELLRPASRHVDHIDGLGPNGPRGFDPSNWCALCVSCHSRKTAADHRFGLD